jgi:hypothetical protein
MAALVSEQTYRKLTGDLRSPVSDVTAALAVAQGLVEVRLERALGLGEHTESLRVYPSSTVYPSVTPLAAGQDGYLDAVTLRVESGSSEVWQSSPRVTLTYTGGYEDDTLPQPLAQGICLVAQHLMSPSSGVGMNGIKSYSEGDISATFEHSVDSTWPAGVDSLLVRYRHREAASA